MDNNSYPAYKGKLTQSFIDEAARYYRIYKGQMSDFRNKVRDNDKWYKCNYGCRIKPGTNEPGPATAFITNAIFNRYADFIDNYPVPNILERSPEDTDAASKLREIIPALLESTGFKTVYKRNCYNKMKNGSGIYGVFYDEDNNALSINAVSVMDFFCDIHARDIQESHFVFVRSAVRNDELTRLYPDFAAFFTGESCAETLSGTQNPDDCTEVLDCYYKKPDGSVHMMKLINESIVIDATEDTPGYERGLYLHGQYPFVIDTMYPDDDNIMGFSLIDITRNPQMYIDKLDAAILKNAMLASKPRWIIKENGGINKKEFSDMSKEVISSATDVDEKNIRMCSTEPLPGFVMEHRAVKITELKEIAGNRDWNNGGTNNGVTAASAIEALQNTGIKASRANIDDTYDSYKRIIYMVIELVRQFFDSEKTYRVTDKNGHKSFIGFSNRELLRGGRRAEFDIAVIPQREDPFTRENNNKIITELWSGGFFAPQNMETAVIALQCMHFDSRDKLIELMQEYMASHQQGHETAISREGGQRN